MISLGIFQQRYTDGALFTVSHSFVQLGELDDSYVSTAVKHRCYNVYDAFCQTAQAFFGAIDQ